MITRCHTNSYSPCIVNAQFAHILTSVPITTRCHATRKRHCSIESSPLHSALMKLRPTSHGSFIYSSTPLKLKQYISMALQHSKSKNKGRLSIPNKSYISENLKSANATENRKPLLSTHKQQRDCNKSRQSGHFPAKHATDDFPQKVFYVAQNA